MRYGYVNNLTHKNGWEWVDPYLDQDVEFGAMVRAFRAATSKAPKYKFGIQVPDNSTHAFALDKEKNDDGWRKSLNLEIEMLNKYGTFKVVPDGVPLPKGYKRIPYHMSLMSSLMEDFAADL